MEPGNGTSLEYLRNHWHLTTSFRVRLKDHARGAEAATEMARVLPADAESQRRSGLYLLDCCVLALGDKALAPDERLRLAKDYATRSFAVSRHATKLEPANVQARFDLAWTIVRAPDAALRDAALALEVAREAVGLDPESPGCRLALGAALARAGQWAEAIAVLDGIGEQDGEPGAYQRLFLALSLAGKGEATKARTLLEAAGAREGDGAFAALRAEVEGALGGR